MQDLTTFLANHPLLSGGLVVVIILVIIIEALRSKQSSFALSPMQATQLINHNNAVVIDIRTPEIYRKGHIIDAEMLNVSDLPSKKIEKFKNKPLIIIDGSGQESQKVATNLRKLGYNSYSITGGMRGWLDAQMPIIKE